MNLAYIIHLLTLVALFFILGASYNLLAGFTGMSNLGQPGIFLLGAYTAAILQMKFGFSAALALPAAALVGSVFAALFSVMTKRARGDVVGVMGLWSMFMLVVVALNWAELTRGALGIPGIARPQGWESPERFVMFMIFAAIVIYGVLRRVTGSPFGRVLGAVRDDELGAATLGKNVFKARAIAFMISGAVGGLGGGLLAYFFRFIDPSSFYILMLVAILAIVYVGGLASWVGTLAGVALVILLPEVLRFLPFNPEIVGAMRQIVFSVLVLAVILWRPKGVLGRVEL